MPALAARESSDRGVVDSDRGRAGRATDEALVRDELRGPVSELVRRVVVELTGEEIPRPVSERSRLVAAIEVQLECVDSLETKLR
jgi:hypothetical protein